MGKLLRKEDLNKFLYKIKTKNEVIAPVKEDAILRYKTIKFISQINLERLPDFSPKKYFLENDEVIFYHKDSKIIMPKKIKSRVIFGLRLCDVAAISVLDKIFLDDKKDPLYAEKREKTLLIGLHCSKEIGKNCFCTSLNLKNKADLFFYDIGDSYYIEVGSEKGHKLVSRLKDYYYEPEIITTQKVLERKDLSQFYNHKLWDEEAKKCIGCARCTTICPTCLCYKINDENNLNEEMGKMTRSWMSCQEEGFWESLDAKTHPKKQTASKLKHKVYHKLIYFKKKHGFEMCTGCGRCITFCPKNIDFVETINRMD